MTERLHYEPLRLTREAIVAGHASYDGRPSLLLDRSVFYPESGGQMADRGTIGESRVVDVQVDEAGQIHHLIEGEPPPLGAAVLTVVDEARRRQHMALHSAQHALSRALLDAFDAVTLSSRLGETACTIDVDRAGITLEALIPVEERVNALVDDDRPVRQYFPDEAELERLALRKPPPDTDRVRVVAIDGFDVTPCGGTHVTHTAQIEIVWIQAVERYKKGSRITFSAGPRARRALREEADRLRRIAARLRCAPPEVGDIVEGLHEKLEAARNDAGRLRARLADLWQERLDGGPEVVAVVPDADAALLQLVAERLLRRAELVVLASPTLDGTDVLVARSRGPAHDGEPVHCGELLKRIAAASGGRGGGRPDHARGRLPQTVDAADWPQIVAASR
jgi:alanyl-tRNA synthetase